jgi:hypothetical protein
MPHSLTARRIQFAGPNELLMGAFVAAGPSNSVVVDRQGMYWMTGKVSKLGILPGPFLNSSA